MHLTDQNASLQELCKYIKNNDNDSRAIHKIAALCKNKKQWENLFESLFKLLFLFKVIENVSSDRYIFQIGNHDTGFLSINNIEAYLATTLIHNTLTNNVITLYDSHKKAYIYIICKFYNSVDFINTIDINETIGCVSRKDRDVIILCVRDKPTFLEEVVKTKIPLCLFDLNTLIKSYKNLHVLLKGIKFNNYNNIFFKNNDKPYLNLRFHQLITVTKIRNLMRQGEKTFLIGAKCRSGKTFMCGGIISNMYREKKYLNVMVITTVPNETIPQFMIDMFDYYADFKDFKKIYLNGETVLNLKLAKNNIFMVSKQFLERYHSNNTIKNIKDLSLDVIFFDENHCGGTTELAENILSSYATDKTIKVFMTATFMKPRLSWSIPNDCVLRWDIEDEQYAKHRNTKALIKRHGLIAAKLLETNAESMLASYDSMPDMHLISYMFNPTIFHKLKKLMNTEEQTGFSLDSVLETKGNKNPKFVNINAVKILFRIIFGSHEEEDFSDESISVSVLKNIRRACTKFKTRKAYTFMIFLPPNHIDQCSQAFSKLLLNDSVGKKFAVLCINGKRKINKDSKTEIDIAYKKANDECKDGLIILAGNMLSLGITIPSCDVVMLLHNTHACDKIHQQMYRCMTEGKDKKIGFVVDMNIGRVINTCIMHHSPGQKEAGVTAAESIKYVTHRNLIKIDVNYFSSIERNSEEVAHKMLEHWNAEPISNINGWMKELSTMEDEISDEAQQILEQYTQRNCESTKGSNKVIFACAQQFPSGIQRIREITEKKSDNENNSDSDNIQEEKTQLKSRKAELNRDILPVIIPLGCQITIENTSARVMDIINSIAANPEQKDALNSHGKLLFGCDDIVWILQNLSKFIDSNEFANEMCTRIKMKLLELIDRPLELYAFIESTLRPKELEKKQFGEVFTPMDLVNKMLDHLPKHVWSDKTLTWFDPASGLGNFMVAVYLRLMKGLADVIPSESKRKSHILEKMLFMCEINKKNVYLCKRIFDSHNNYKLNIHFGDSLEFNTSKKKGWPESFSIIVGNPPYNKSFGGKNGYAAPLYHSFVERYIDQCDMMLFIIPSRWFSGGKGLDQFRKNMLKRQDIKYIDTIADSDHPFGQGVQIKGGVCHFLKDSSYNGKCNYNGVMTKLNYYDILVDSKYIPLIEKVLDFDNITSIYCSKGHYGIPLTDERLHSKEKPGDLRCFVSKMKGSVAYISNKKAPTETLGSYKLITVTATSDGGGFGNMFVGGKNDMHSESYISFNTRTKSEAESLKSYLECRLINVLLVLRKLTHNISKKTCAWIPLVPLDRAWTDAKLCRYFRLSEDEIKLGEDMVINNYTNVIKNEHPRSRRSFMKHKTEHINRKRS
jgi:site-specific DNA-methyltransferase (adenine-specific)